MCYNLKMPTSKSNIKLTRIENYEPSNSAWIVHMILAEVDNEFAGYLKISYIPESRFDKKYPDLLHFLASTKGWCTLKTGLELKDLDLIIEELDIYNKYKKPIFDFELKLQALTILTEDVTCIYQEEYRGFKEYHVDKPIIDMVRVYDSSDSYAFSHDYKHSILRENLVDFKHQGIGTMLYKEAARWMAEKNLCLYASNTQTEDAKRMWLKLSNTCNIKNITPLTTNKEYMKPRKYLDFRGLDLTLEL